MLLWAFGPAEAAFPAGVDGGRAVALADALGLSARIGARHQRGLDEFGPVALETFRKRMWRAAAAGISLEALAEEVARTAAGRGIPIALLKRAALVACGVTLAEGRPACDVDVLVPARRARELQDALVAGGLEPSPLDSSEHHLPSLTDRRRGGVELHTVAWGVRAPGAARFAAWEDLEATGCLVPLDDSRDVFVPTRAFLVAHALVHGVVQHGNAPRSYTLMNVVADLLDLGFVGEAGSRLADEARPFLAGVLAEEEVGSVLRVCGRLGDGTFRISEEADDDLGPAFLRHVVAAAIDERYRKALKLRQLRPRLASESLLARLSSTLFPEPARLAALYPGLARRRALGVARAVRPFHLVGKLVADVVAAGRLRGTCRVLPPPEVG